MVKQSVTIFWRIWIQFQVQFSWKDPDSDPAHYLKKILRKYESI